jgi:nitrite reductase/ring-hydroxylating ferredoxin subunit
VADHVVGREDEFADGDRRIVNHGKREVGVFRVGDNFYALPNVCTHQFGPLCHGEITGTLVATEESRWQVSWVREGEVLICPWHALEFDITTGQCLARPSISLRQYPVRVENGDVIVEL